MIYMKEGEFEYNSDLDHLIYRLLETKSREDTPDNIKKLIKKYKTCRKVGFNLNHKMMDKCLDRDTLNKSAKLLGIIHKGKFAFENEDDTSVLMDFALNDYRFVNKNVVRRYNEKFGWENMIEKNIFNALSASYTSLFKITSILRSENTLILKDILNKKDDIKLMDIAFSNTINHSNYLIFTRILPFKDFNMTSGVSFIFPSNMENHLIKQYNKKNIKIKSTDEDVKRFVTFYQLHKKHGIDVSYI